MRCKECSARWAREASKPNTPPQSVNPTFTRLSVAPPSEASPGRSCCGGSTVHNKDEEQLKNELKVLQGLLMQARKSEPAPVGLVDSIEKAITEHKQKLYSYRPVGEQLSAVTVGIRRRRERIEVLEQQ
eukprot:10845319-Karenia_brevis.AAC.1